MSLAYSKVLLISRLLRPYDPCYSQHSVYVLKATEWLPRIQWKRTVLIQPLKCGSLCLSSWEWHIRHIHLFHLSERPQRVLPGLQILQPRVWSDSLRGIRTNSCMQSMLTAKHLRNHFWHQHEKWTSCFEMSLGHTKHISFTEIPVPWNRYIGHACVSNHVHRRIYIPVYLRQHPRNKLRSSKCGLVPAICVSFSKCDE